MDEERIRSLAEDHTFLVTLEENVLTGGFGERVTEFVTTEKLPLTVLNIAIVDDYIEHGNVEILRREAGIDEETILRRIRMECFGEEL